MDPKRKGSPWLRELYELFEPVRKSLAVHSEEKINEAIDEAIAAVRQERSERHRRAKGKTRQDGP